MFESMLADEGVRLPGDRRLVNRKQTPETGVHTDKALYDKVVAIRDDG